MHGLGVVGEGIETAGQAAELRALGCDQGQGSYFACPLPRKALEALIASKTGLVLHVEAAVKVPA